MPNQRAADQKLLPFTVKKDFVRELDDGLRQLRISNRSHFIREAIREKLANLGVNMSADLVAAHDRFGKGGPRPSSAPKVTAAADKVHLAVKKHLKKPGPKV